MKGYKATYNGKCKGQLYEVGQTYSIDSILIMCQNGFHFCNKLEDVFDYYPPKHDIKVFEVEALGKTITDENKSVTNKIKIIRELSNKELKKHFILDKNNNIIYFKNNDRYEYWQEYDQNNNVIHYKSNSGYEYWQEFDQNNNLINKRYK